MTHTDPFARIVRDNLRQAGIKRGVPCVWTDERPNALGDGTRPLDLPPLNGLLMANALHFQRKKDGILQLIYNTLQPGGRFILVEYNVDRGNFWVPHPLSYPTWEKLAGRSGFVDTRLLRTRASSFLREIYSAVSFRRNDSIC